MKNSIDVDIKRLIERLGSYLPEKILYTCSKDLQKNLIKSLKEHFSKDLEILEYKDSSVQVGYKVIAGDFMLDSSVDAEVDLLRQKIDVENVEIEDLNKVISKGLSNFEFEATISEIGAVTSTKDGVAFVEGLSNCMNQEVLYIGDHKVRALAMNLDKKSIGAVILGDYKKIKEGDIVFRSEQVMSAGVGEAVIGRVVNALGDAIDGGAKIDYMKYHPIERIAPGVMDRKPVAKPLQTGVKAIDTLIPIGRGQRELILGDRQTGKTSIAIDTILNQKGQDVICIYVAIGQKASKVAELTKRLEEEGAMEYTTVVLATASDAAPLQYISPYTGVTIAEYFAAQGKDVLIVYDDLSKHAVAYREMSLLLRRPPGREAYPGDVFFIHSRLLERACSLSDENGGGSITALPIIETQAGDISAYIPTNVISITDGQIFLESELFYKGIRPAINVGLSVSRVGSAAQTKPMKKVAGSIKLTLAQFRELEAFAQFSSDLDKTTKAQIERGRRVTEILKQPLYSPVPMVSQVISILAVSNGLLDSVELKDIGEIENALVEQIINSKPDLINEINSGNWNDEIQEKLLDKCKRVITSITSEDGE